VLDERHARIARVKIDDNTSVGTFGTSAGRFALVSLSLFFAACGGATAAEPHAAFASMQVDEARIEHASLALERDAETDARASDRDEICAASAHLCETAHTLDDADARTRCAHAEERCARARAELAP
jgi:hypothetical protein